MKKGERKFLVILGVLFLIYVATSFLAPKPVNWSVTFASNDKNPFGGFILSERADDLFEGSFIFSNKTIAELHDLENLLILCEYAEITGTDYRSLLSKLDSGANVFIAANQFSPTMMDSLEFDELFSYHILNQTLFEEGTSKIIMEDSTEYEYPFSMVSNYFDLEDGSSWEVKATLEGNAVAITKNMGKGQLTLSSTPYIFTNFGLLYNKNYEAAAKLLTELPERETHFTQYYQLGKGEATTPLRYFLTNSALRWSLYTGLFTILVFLVVTSRRVQRPVPVVTPPVNTTVSYVKTLGALFYREGKHKKAAQRLVSYFLRDIREKYFLHVDYTEKFYKHLSAKSGVEITIVIQTFELILKIRDVPYIDEKTLIDLSKKIEQF